MPSHRKSRKTVALAIVAWTGAGAGVLVALPLGAAPAAPDEPARCVRYWGEARYVIGYDQLVHVQNGCDRPAECVVSTDRNPKAQTVRLAPAEHQVVTTWLGAASSSFTPVVSCKLEGG